MTRAAFGDPPRAVLVVTGPDYAHRHELYAALKRADMPMSLLVVDSVAGWYPTPLPIDWTDYIPEPDISLGDLLIKMPRRQSTTPPSLINRNRDRDPELRWLGRLALLGVS